MRRALVFLASGSRSPGRSWSGTACRAGDRATSPVAVSGVVDEVRAALADRYYRPVPPSVLQLGSVDRMISALGDPYTSYLAPPDVSLLRQATASRYSGIGASVLPARRGLVIVALGPGRRSAPVCVPATRSFDRRRRRTAARPAGRARADPRAARLASAARRSCARRTCRRRRAARLVRAPAVESDARHVRRAPLGRSPARRRSVPASRPACGTGSARSSARARTASCSTCGKTRAGCSTRPSRCRRSSSHRGVVVSLRGAHNPRRSTGPPAGP